jgi:yecA family protein
MALTLPEETTDPVAAIVQELEAAEYRPEAALRRAVVYADGIAPAVIALVNKAADGVYLLPKQQRLFFWGLHILAAARCTTLYRPLLSLLHLDRAEYLDDLFGNALTESLPRILISIFDGNAGGLFELCSQKSTDEYLRWGVLEAIARLTFDGAIPRPMTVEFLSRFERENLADPGEAAWEGWQDAIALLSIAELHDRVRATWRDERSPSEPSDQEIIEEWFARSLALAPGDPELFDRDGRKPIDDPIEALAWTASESPERKQEDNPFGPDPAADIALQAYEIRWLSGFLDSTKVPDTTLTLEWIDGLFCALNVGPSAPPSEYMPVIWNPEDDADTDVGPIYDSAEQADYVVGLLNRHWNSIARRLDAGFPHWPALECEPDELDARYWAGGFIRGVAMRAEVWGTRKDNEFVMAFLQMMVTLGMREKDLSESDIDFELRGKLVDALPIQLVRMHHLWHGREDPFPPPTPTHYESHKVGRNEPCPCGSGKKFKRCCGSPTSSFH